jgi:hypothetical protein
VTGTTELDLEVEALEGLDLQALRVAWAARFGAPPKLRSPEILRLMLAWRIQAQALGGLPPEARRALRRPIGETPRPLAISETRLIREWGGARHEVTVVGPRSFLYGGQTFSSLSVIARTITGVRWNGPRFFGLRHDSGGK